MNQKSHLKDSPRLVKAYVGVSFLAVCLWQLYLLVIVYLRTPDMEGMLDALGMDLPKISALFLSAYPYLLILPVITIILGLDLVRRKSIPFTYGLICFVFVVLATLAFQAWTVEAFYTPIFKIIEHV
jgi:hypothetical protein